MLIHKRETPKLPDRVVILGAKGFVGRALSSKLEDLGVEFVCPDSSEIDLTNRSSVGLLSKLYGENDVLIMLAALTPDRGRDINTFMLNLEMSRHVCAAVQAHAPSQIVYLSSDAVYPLSIHQINEKTPADVEDLYGAMHRAREIMFQSVTGDRLAILRSTLVYGAEDTHNSYGPNRLRRMAAKEGKITLFGAGEETRDHILVDDLALMIVEVLRNGSVGLLNVASGKSITFDELAKKVSQIFENEIEIVHTPRQNPVTHRHFDITELLRALPKFRFTEIEAGLEKAHREMMKTT